MGEVEEVAARPLRTADDLRYLKSLFVIAITAREAASRYDSVNLREEFMRKLTLVAAAAILSMASLMTTAQAIPFVGAGIRTAIESTNPVEKAYCWINSWGRYRCTYGRR